MVIESFFSTYNGKYIDYDGSYGFQCVDLVREYINKVLGWAPYIALPQMGDAQQIFKDFPEGGTKYFIKIKNGPTNMPQKGDIVFWGYPFGFYFYKKVIPRWAGHVAIGSVSWLMGLNTFDQNLPKGSFCKFTLHNYKGCLGWLRPRK